MPPQANVVTEAAGLYIPTYERAGTCGRATLAPPSSSAVDGGGPSLVLRERFRLLERASAPRFDLEAFCLDRADRPYGSSTRIVAELARNAYVTRKPPS